MIDGIETVYKNKVERSRPGLKYSMTELCFCFLVDDQKSVMDVALISNMDPVNIGLGCSEKAGPVTSLKPRKKTMTSVYLKFFETAVDGKTRRCKFCGQSYSIATATGYYFLHHLLLTRYFTLCFSFLMGSCISFHHLGLHIIIHPKLLLFSHETLN